MKGVQVVFTFAALLHIPLFVYLARAQVYIYGKISPGWMTHFFYTFVILGIGAVVPIFVPNILNAIGLMGGTSGGMVAYITPLLLAIKAEKNKFSLRSLFFLAILLFNITICAVTSGYSLYAIIFQK